MIVATYHRVVTDDGLWLCPAGFWVPPLLRQNGLSRWAMGGLLKVSAGIFLS